MNYVFPGMRDFIARASEQLGVHCSVADIEKMPPIRQAAMLLAQLGTCPDPADLIDSARQALMPCRVAVLAGELVIKDLIERNLVPPSLSLPKLEVADPETGETQSMREGAMEAASAVHAIADHHAAAARKRGNR